ncbi:MAG: 2Fe-2S iron-sulfur cluster-binding protein, partial [Hyphomicrobium sp.]
MMPFQRHRMPVGGLIDRSRKIRFAFDGVNYAGYAGDTLASALLANGVKLTGRSFKYHRPRGIMSAGSEEPNALVELRTGAYREANTKATTIEIFEGLKASSQNRWPSLAFDVMAINSLLSPVFVAGFYYKTFMWPAALWEKLYEPLIRRAAGLGRASAQSDPDTYEKATAFCDVLVIGGGTAGLTAALQAGRSGARVLLADENATLGGRAIDDGADIDGLPAAQWVSSAITELASLKNVRVFKRTTVFGAYDGGTFGAVERVSDHLAKAPTGQPRQRLWHVVAKQSIVAAGATERPIVFANNDRPGVMLAGAVRTYINRYGVRPGQRAVVFANNDYAASTVASLNKAGVDVVALVDSRETPSEGVRAILNARGTRLISSAVISSVSGKLRVKGVTVRTADGRTETLACDLVAMSGGWTPNIQLTTHLGGKPVWLDAIGSFVPGKLPPGMSAAGAASGAMGLRDALESGLASGSAAARAAGFTPAASVVPRVENDSSAFAPLWRVDGGRGKAFVDMQNDVAVGDIELANREGFRSVEHLKRYTT